ncbi:electron transfer flavoprotein subunit alpha/FixB family protein [Adlercreutzia sp. R7]|uniref:Electron transfer flavoprotein subunit alpha/FixB family protein n=1 Tax=Adlercreutzia wanghongyangiae TaxID=3111451 RepID=A0ABU6IEH8_9ACTN|nr:electron transfer flavoprotein subunit alpha/FixB family protein [Adlercreutzia sp. R7]
MTKVYIFAESAAAAAELATWARRSGAASSILAVGDAGDLAGAGADEVIVLKGGSERPEDYAIAIAAIVGEDAGGLLLASSTVAGREVAANVAGRLGCAMVSDASSLELRGTFLRAERTVLGGAVVDVCEAPLPCVATVAPGIVEPEPAPQESAVEERVVEVDGRIVRRSLSPFPVGDVDLEKASVVVCVGMGIDGPEDVAMAQKLADGLGGAVGCTRDVAEGRKLLPKDRYIGITGAIVKPELYLSMGVSGQLQHVYGMRDSKVVVAVDSNKDAPIFRAADYGVVGDLHEVVPQIIAAVGAH